MKNRERRNFREWFVSTCIENSFIRSDKGLEKYSNERKIILLTRQISRSTFPYRISRSHSLSKLGQSSEREVGLKRRRLRSGIHAIPRRLIQAGTVLSLCKFSAAFSCQNSRHVRVYTRLERYSALKGYIRDDGGEKRFHGSRRIIRRAFADLSD